MKTNCNYEISEMETIQYKQQYEVIVQQRNYTYRMKDKTLAAMLALILGQFGVHRFYLGQIGLGLLYLIPGIGFILSIIDFIAFLSMDQDVFDIKYNKRYMETTYRKRNTDFDRSARQRQQAAPPVGRPNRSDLKKEREAAVKKQRQAYKAKAALNENPYKKSGIEKFKDYDFDGAIDDFEKALTVNDKDPSIHFNLACAYSLTEQKGEAFFHLDKAVKCGFKLFDKIKTHDALAYLRIQDEYEDFEKNNFQLNIEIEHEEAPALSGDLLDQLKRLGELRERGLLTEEEFSSQKKKLLR